MENERPRIIRVFRSAVSRNFRSPWYWFKLIGVAVLALLAPFILNVILTAAQKYPPEIVEAFRQGNCYTIGLLSIPSKDPGILTRFDDIALSVISGSVTQCIAVISATGFIASEFSGGYLKLALMRGEKRFILYGKYIAVCVLGSLPVIAVSPLCVMISLSAQYGLAAAEPSRIALRLITQAVMLLALVVCFSSIAITLNGKGGSVIALCALLAMPLIPTYLSFFTGGKVQIKDFSLISRLADSAGTAVSGTAGDLLAAAITAAVFYLLGSTVFLSRNFD